MVFSVSFSDTSWWSVYQWLLSTNTFSLIHSKAMVIARLIFSRFRIPDCLVYLFSKVDYRNLVQKLMVLYSWLTTLFFSVCPLLGWSSISYEISKTSCTVIYFPNQGYESYIIVSAVFCFVIPVLALTICKIRYFKVSIAGATLSVSNQKPIESHFFFKYNLFSILNT
jgi:hypothetical protein